MFGILDVHGFKKSLDKAILEDIKAFGKPALIYNFHHAAQVLNTIDEAKDWKTEQENMKTAGLTLTPEKKSIKFGKAGTYDCIIWTAQPLGSDNLIDEKKYKKMTNHMVDPLGMAVGYMISGFCYLQPVIKIQN